MTTLIPLPFNPLTKEMGRGTNSRGIFFKMKFKHALLVSAATLLSLASSGLAEVSLPHVFGDNMVLQRGQPVPVWGWAAPGEKISVEFAGQRRSVTTDPAGKWAVRLRPLKASAQPAEMKISGANQIALTNVLVGEVWLCSGQSNMEKPIGTRSGQKPTRDHLQELAAADCPQIRLFLVKPAMSGTPVKDITSDWQVCSSNSLEETKFSAVGYFFAREIQKELNVPIGLIESSWGGTRIEPWTPAVGFKSVPSLEELAFSTASGTNKPANTHPMVIYNAMIAPLVAFAIRGALWYQGESNCMGDHPDGNSYTAKMAALIQGWREVWGQKRLPFYYVQIAPFHYFHSRTPRVPTADALPEFWEAQTRALRIPDTGMAVITDLVENLNDIHPTQKKEVGQRLANLALAKTYEQKSRVCYGPMFKSAKFSKGRAVVTFDHAEGGLVNRDGRPLTWFTIAGADGKFVKAEAKIEGDKVVVRAASVAEPKAVRFAWDEGAQPNLFNAAGLPAGPFRTGNPPAPEPIRPRQH